MKESNIGFVGIGNLGKNLAKNILLAEYNLYIHDIDKTNAHQLIKKGAIWCSNLKELVNKTTIIITCLPNPKVVSNVLESENGILKYLNKKHIIIECSTTDEEELLRLSKLIYKKKAGYLEAPLTGGEWRSKKGNISIISAGKRKYFKRCLPLLKEIGYEIVYLGNRLGSASTLKVLTNYLASINLVALGEVLMISKKYNINLKSAYEAIRVSSGNSFVHTSESQLILSRSMNAQFTMNLICKDLTLVEKLRKKFKIPSKFIPLLLNYFLEGKKKLGNKEYSTAIVKLLEDKCKSKLYHKSFPKILIDKEKKRKGFEVKI